MMNAVELLNEFRQRRSEHAFAELVRRFSNLVFSVAKRRLNNAALAEEAAQSVFLRLAKSAPNLSTEPELIGWLHRTSLHVAVDLWRSETRRRAREEKAAAMQSIESIQPNENSSNLALALDEALDDLSDSDRQALLLRFFDGRKMRELAENLGITEDAAKMRVSRSLDRLRERLASHGIQTTTVLLAAFLTEQAVTAIPAAITQSILRAVAPMAAGASWLMRLTPFLQWKFAALVAGLGLAVVLVTSHQSKTSLSAALDKNSVANSTHATAVQTSTTVEPIFDEAIIAANPLKLLEHVARARNRITSGNIQYEQAVELFENSAHGAADTNSVTGQIIFDGGHRRIEQIGFEYRYVGVGEAGEPSAKLIKEQKLNHAQAMRAGLIEQFESHHVSAFDGSVILDYWETDGRPFQTAIRDPKEGGGVGDFDPRCLGLRAFSSTTVENGLSLNSTNATLVGQEDVEGAPAWHIRVKYYDIYRDYWVNVAQPDRLLKVVDNGDIITSRYASERPRDPLPVEVISQTRNYVKRFRRTASEYNIPVDPAIFTLAGLGMQRGTPVDDYRTSRSLGYWTGAGLSEKHPSKEDNDSPNTYAPTLQQHLATLDAEPDTARGLDAALWILFNTPDGPELEKAGKIILDYHLQSTNLLNLAIRLESLRPHCAKQLLTEILGKNPDAEIRGTACFSLAQTFMDEAEFGANQKATDEAKNYFQRFIRDFSTAGKTAFDKKYKSTKAIEEIDHGFIGHEAPNFTAATTSGETLNTAETRGSATLILFRSSQFKHDADEYRKVYDKVAGRDVTFVTVFEDTASKSANLEDAVEASAPGWLMIRDGRSISDTFYIHSWLSTVLIDKRGTIRQRNLRGEALEKAILAATAN